MDTCAICLDKLSAPGVYTYADGERLCCDDVCVLRCEHIFHTVCLQAWKVRNSCCPVCRGPIVCTNHETHGHHIQSMVIDEQSKIIAEQQKEIECLQDRVAAYEHQNSQSNNELQDIIFFLFSGSTT